MQATVVSRVPSSLWLLLPPAAGCAWCMGKTLPLVMLPTLVAAFAFLLVAGSLAQLWVDGHRPPGPEARPAAQPGIFQLLFLGQYAVMALALAITPAMALLADVTGRHVPLRYSLPGLLVLLTLLTRRRLRARGFYAPGIAAASMPLAGLIGLVVFRGFYLHSRHAGALGHDTQQHLYWTKHIADFGFLPFTARGSDLLDGYPKFFHLLSASWSACGLTSIVGPYVKSMPMLQTALACGLLCELAVAPTPPPTQGSSCDIRPVLLGLLAALHLSLGDGQQIYSVPDLSGTPRFSGGWILFALPLLVLAHVKGTFRDIRPWLVGLVPVLSTIAVGTNPVLLVFFLTFSLTLAGALYFLAGRSLYAGSTPWRKALGWGGAVGLVCVLANPLVVEAASSHPTVAALLGWFGVRVSAAGIQATDWIVPRAPLCSEPVLACAVSLGKVSLAEASASIGSSFGAGSLPGLEDRAQGHWYVAAFAVGFLPLLLSSLGGPRAARVTTTSIKLCAAILAASLLATMTHPFTVAALHRVEPLGGLWPLLLLYFHPFELFVGSWLRCLLVCASWFLLRPIVLAPRWFGSVCVVAVAGLLCCLHDFAVPELAAHRFVDGAAKLNWGDLQAIERLNEFVPGHEAVLIPATHWFRSEEEHILTADNPSGMVVPLLTTRLLFGVRLGTGRDFGWADFEYSFCGPPERRRTLLRRANARWVLIRGPGAASRFTFDAFRWDCGVMLTDLDAEYPPAWSERDMALFRINP